MLGEADIIKLDYLRSLSPKTIALLQFNGYPEIYTIMRAKDGHVALQMDRMSWL